MFKKTKVRSILELLGKDLSGMDYDSRQIKKSTIINLASMGVIE